MWWKHTKVRTVQQEKRPHTKKKSDILFFQNISEIASSYSKFVKKKRKTALGMTKIMSI